MHDQASQIVSPLAQRRHAQRDLGQAVKERLAEPSPRDLGLQIGVGGRQDPHVDLAGSTVSYAHELARLERPQHHGLDVRVGVDDLVEEQRAYVRRGEVTVLVRDCAAERTADVAEERARRERGRQRPHVHRLVRALRAVARAVDGTRDELLAGATLAPDEHPQPGLRHAVDLATELPHRVPVTDQIERGRSAPLHESDAVKQQHTTIGELEHHATFDLGV